jgi:hypothetical protein
MTHPAEQVATVAAIHRAWALRDEPVNVSRLSRRTGLPRSTVKNWIVAGFAETASGRSSSCGPGAGELPACWRVDPVPAESYAYLLGQYLGDGHVVRVGRSFKLEVFCDAKYPGIARECAVAMATVSGGTRPNRRDRKGCWGIYGYSNHWPCLLPQHGPGKKHDRAIVLEPWQESIVLDAHPGAFLRGLVHSDGCRVVNRIKRSAGGGGWYEYPRYLFTNKSADIRGLFDAACARLDITTGSSGGNTPSRSVARRKDVEMLDRFIGPKE